MRIKIDGNYYDHFSKLQISLKLDAIASTFSFNVRFNPQNPTHKKIFKPLSYKPIEIYNSDNKLILTGVIVNHDFTSTAQPNLLAISGYSKAGILEDCTTPVSSYPLESINRSLKDVAERLTSLFGINFIVDSSAQTQANSIYKKSVASPTDTIKSYLAKLTSQKNVVLSHNEKGDVIVFKPLENTPVAFFNKENMLSMKLTSKGQTIHSDISVIRQPSEDNAGVSTADTIKNPLIDIFRPTTKVLSSGEDTEVTNAADNILAAELKSISISIVLNRVENILPGQIIEIENDEIFIYNRTKFMVTESVIKGDVNAETSEFKLVLPETFTGGIPQKIFNK